MKFVCHFEKKYNWFKNKPIIFKINFTKKINFKILSFWTIFFIFIGNSFWFVRSKWLCICTIRRKAHIFWLWILYQVNSHFIFYWTPLKIILCSIKLRVANDLRIVVISLIFGQIKTSDDPSFPDKAVENFQPFPSYLKKKKRKAWWRTLMNSILTGT